ncbi:thioesterase [Hyunsoonleella pacifica]|nr:thioesterase [Hyunsoonleella pacifica]
MFKLPSAYLCGVRVKYLDDEKCIIKVKHKWINQNPFKSMFWAVQGMAAELSTGALMIGKIQESGKKVSMLVTTNNATFTKKATGKITFTCNDGHLIDEALKKTIETGAGQTIWMKSVGVNEEGVEVSTFNFEWSVKVKQ